MIIELDRQSKKFPKAGADVVYSIEGVEVSAKLVKKLPASLEVHDVACIAEGMRSHGIEINKKNLQAAAKVYESSPKVFKGAFLNHFNSVGCLNVYRTISEKNFPTVLERKAEELSSAFEERFGRSPRVIRDMAIVAEALDIPSEKIASSFSVENFRTAISNMPVGEATVLVAGWGGASPAIFSSPNAQHAVKCYEKFFKTGDKNFEAVGNWICSHPDSSEKFVKKISKSAKSLVVGPDSTVDSVKAQLGGISSATEVEKIEKAYKGTGFKFSKCEFDLRFSETETGNYRAEILRPGDTRMVYLGYLTHCCQKLGDVGESAMMHGLINPKAGFWILSDTRTGRIVAQAEIWEADHNSLVFDNIEFENDMEFKDYARAIAEWVESSAYENVYMGDGYNEIAYDAENGRYNFTETLDPIAPSVTPYEIYVISHEEDSEAPVFDSEEKAAAALASGEVTYYDYVYCDSCDDGKKTLILKDHGELAPYLEEALSDREGAREM